jgi:predicted AlkP superfamily pyrophosphatase or phosphodiesterase
MPSNKVILVLSDGLGYQAAVEGMGYLGHLVESNQACLYKVIGELPSLSRPTYETIHTGLKASVHGIISNQTIRLSNQPNIFGQANQAGKKTAAAAYYWFSELYNHAPYHPIEDREVNDPSLGIQNGRFYTQDEMPDVEVFATAGMLVHKFSPDYLLVHPMGMDHVGERHGGNSSAYRNQAIQQDKWLSSHISEWISLGYQILVTGDHGMNADGMHGGTTPLVREIPLFLMGADIIGLGDTHEVVSQLQIAPTICRLLNLPPIGEMAHLSIG